MNVIIYLIIILLSLIGSYLGYPFVGNGTLQPILSTLQNISAAVFTLAGIWIAYIYPQAISAYTNPEKVTLMKGVDDTTRIYDLILIIFTSALVLAFTLFYQVLFVVFHKNQFFIQHIETVKYIITFIVIALSLTQIKALSSIMVNNFKFLERLYKLKTEKELEDDL